MRKVIERLLARLHSSVQINLVTFKNVFCWIVQMHQIHSLHIGFQHANLSQHRKHQTKNWQQPKIEMQFMPVVLLSNFSKIWRYFKKKKERRLIHFSPQHPAQQQKKKWSTGIRISCKRELMFIFSVGKKNAFLIFLKATETLQKLFLSIIFLKTAL